MDRQRLDVKQAAQILGISTDAVHKRVKRGSLESDKDSDGRVYVYLDDSLDDGYTRLDDGYTPDQETEDVVVEVLRDQVEYLREQLDKEREANRENRRLLAAALERIPELEPAEPREPTVSTSEERGGSETPQDQEQPSWWRRIFGS